MKIRSDVDGLTLMIPICYLWSRTQLAYWRYRSSAV